MPYKIARIGAVRLMARGGYFSSKRKKSIRRAITGDAWRVRSRERGMRKSRGSMVA